MQMLTLTDPSRRLASNAFFETIPTGVAYGIHPHEETRAEPLSALNVEDLLGALLRDSVLFTNITPLHVGGARARRRLAAGVFPQTLARSPIFGYMKLFDSTPSTLERDWVHRETPVPDSPPAYEAFKALGRWLDADDAAIADMVGIGRTTPYTWKREGREPRPATTQRIYEHDATLDALRRRLGVAGFRRWLHEGIPPRRDVLLAGDLERLEDDVHAVLFRRAPTERIDLAAAPEDSGPADASSGRPLRPSGRRPRRARG
jgi:hypothetical protein